MNFCLLARTLFLFVILLGGCATAYQDQGFTGGFTEVRLAEDVYRVSFNGNGYTSRSRAADLNLLRCAELTLEAGFTHFVTVDSDAYVTDHTFYTPTTTTGTINANTRVSGYGNTAYGNTSGTFRSNTYGGQPITVKKPSTENVILMLKGKPSDGFAYDASYLVESLSSSYGVDVELEGVDEAREELARTEQAATLESHRKMAREMGATLLCAGSTTQLSFDGLNQSAWLLGCLIVAMAKPYRFSVTQTPVISLLIQNNL